jgi:hypothetical protein
MPSDSSRSPKGRRSSELARIRCSLQLVFTLLLLVGCQQIPGPLPPPGGTDYPDLPAEPARSARVFGDSVGVNVKLTHVTSSYGNFDAVLARLQELGVRRVADSLCPTCDYQLDHLQRLAQVGIKSSLAIGGWNAGPNAISDGLAAVKSRLGGSAVALSGLNEPDLTGDPAWVSKTRDYTRELYMRAKADPALAHLPVIGPSLVYRESRAELGDLSGFVDRGNLHPYSGGRPPLFNLADERQMMSAVSGSKPLVITEVGYHTDMTETGPHRPASEQAVAAYTPRLVLEAFRSGIERTHIFQLADFWSEAQAAQRNYPTWQNSFGLLRWDLTPKPSFVALRNLMRVVDADSGPVSAPGSLRYAIAGAGSDVRSLLLRSADGSFRLALWRDVSVWNRDTYQDIAPAPDHVDVVLGQPIAQVQRFDPTAGDAPSYTWINPRSIPLDLRGTVVVLSLRP